MLLKLKPAKSPTPVASFSWDTLPVSPSSSSTSSAPPRPPPSPPTVWIDAKHMRIFGDEPLHLRGPEFGVVKCKECEKPILRGAFTEHADKCKEIRTNAKKGSKLDGKKRSAEEEAGPEDTSIAGPNGAKKKAKPATKITKGRIKGPIDFDRQCGVINDKGQQCSRALTCKSHSMGAKRAVQGRSKAYDELLTALQIERNPDYKEKPKRQTKQEKQEKKEKEKQEKKRIAAEQAAAVAAVKIASGGGSSKKSKKSGGSGGVGGSGTVTMQPVEEEIEEENMDEIDSEAELDSLVKAVRTAQTFGLIGAPLAVPRDAGSWFVARRETLRNCGDQLAGALMSRPTRIPAPT